MQPRLCLVLAILVRACAEISLGALSAFPIYADSFLAILAAHFDFRKHFEPELRARLGEPIIILENGLHENMSSVLLRHKNTEFSPSVGVSNALELFLGLDGETPVAGLIGASASSVTIPVTTIAAARKIPQISPSSTALALSNKESYPFFLRTLPPDSGQASAMWHWILEFQVPSATCVYTNDGYALELYEATKGLSRQAGQAERVQGQPLRHMPQTFDAEEARLVARTVKQMGSRFILLVVFSTTLLQFLPILGEVGMLGPGWQYLGSDSSLQADVLELLPVGYMMIGFVNQGELYPRFTELVSKMGVDDFLGQESIQRYKLDVHSSDRERVNSTLSTLSSNQYASFAFDATYTFLIAINSLKHQGLNDSEISGEVLLAEIRRSRFLGISGEVSFDENGDRYALYFLKNVVPNGAPRDVAIFSVSKKQFTFAENLTWMDGSVGNFAPRELVSCDPGEEYRSDCPRGAFANQTGSSNCTECAEGYFAAYVGSVDCDPCPSGYEGLGKGLDSCSRCKRGFYMPFDGATKCLPCGKNQITLELGAKEESQCQCAEGEFMCDEDLDTGGCMECPVGLACNGSKASPRQQAGLWVERRENCDFQVLRCRNIRECPEGALGTCASGREGRACNNCKQKHFSRDDGTCKQCSEEDSLPSILLFVFVPLIIILVNFFSLDPNQQSLNLLTAAAVTSQIIMSVQALGSIRELAIDWPEPVKSVINLTRLLTLDLDVIKIGCLFGTDDPTVKFLSQLLICPAGCCLFLLSWTIQQTFRRKVQLDYVINLCGLLLFALFLSITLSTIIPFLCQQNPDGSSSMVSEPGILCFDSEEHPILVILAIIGILSQPVAILCWTTYTTLMYPFRVSNGAGLRLVHRYRFLFHRFKPESYYYGLLLLYRNALVATLPVALSRLPELQIPIMGGVLLASLIVQARTNPWRTVTANMVELLLTAFLMVTLLGAAPLLELNVKLSSSILGWLLCIPIFCLITTGLFAMLRPLLLHFQGTQQFDIFLCHHKAGAGSLCRLLKLLAVKHSSSVCVFLDCDQLENLDILFDVVRSSTKNVVVVLTPELLKRVWCAGEIATAHKNKIETIPLVCDGFRRLTSAQMMAIPSLWTVQQTQMLANHGITIDDVMNAYTWLQSSELTPMKMPRFGQVGLREKVVVDLLHRCYRRRVSGLSKAPVKRLLAGRPVQGYESKEYARGRVLITSSVADAESLSTCEVFQLMLQAHLQVECVVVQGSRQMVSWKPWAYYLVVLLFRGMFRDPGFGRILAAAFDGTRRPLEVVTVIADPQFDFPSVDVYETETKEDDFNLFSDETSPLSKQAYRHLLNVVALPFSPFASDGLQKKQVTEIAQRFHRYKEPAVGVTRDQLDDQLLFEEEQLEHPGAVLGSISPSAFGAQFDPPGRSPYAMIHSDNEDEDFEGLKYTCSDSLDSLSISI
eukprot:symbB.v1.2.032056.t1/scaffold3795.1/size50223/4